MKIWEGTYPDFASINPGIPANHAPEEWVEKSLSRLEQVRQHDGKVVAELFSSNPLAILPPLIDLVSRSERAIITDVGGNLGQLYNWVTRWVSPHFIDWHIVEKPELLSHPKVRENLNPVIGWHLELASAPVMTNLLFFGSSIQYIENLEDDVLPFLKRAAPKWVVVGDAMTGESIPTFVTRQNYFDSFFPSKFRNLRELLETFRESGYDCVSQEEAVSRANASYYPSAGLPPGLQIDFPLDLIFLKR